MRDIGTSSHEAHPFRVVGILARTFTPIDRSLYVSLDGLRAMHDDEGAEATVAPLRGASASLAEGTRSAEGGASRAAAEKRDRAARIREANKKRAAAMAPPPGTPTVMPGAEPPPGTPAVMPGASPPPGTPLVMPGASPPPGTPLVMPGAEPPPAVVKQVEAAASAAQSAARASALRAASASDTVAPRSGATEHSAPSADQAAPDHPDEQITAFLVGTKNRFEALMLQREMNTDFQEPLTAVIPGVALGELWQNIGSAEVGLRVVAIFAVAIGLTGMLVSLYSSLDARRREMAILRAIGAGPRTIVALLVLESGLLALLGCVLGVAFVYGGLALAQQPIEQRFGLHLAMRPLGSTEWTYLAVVMSAGILIGFVPAWKAYRTSLVDGLSPRA
jgi:putative ABC transport system permease protein